MSLAEPIRIISDLHFGHPASLVENAEALAPLFRDVGTVVFNGDTVEMRFLRGRVEGKRKSEALRAQCVAEGAQPIFINGNHDPILSSDSHLDLVGGAVLVTHGDMLFHDIAPWSRESKIMRHAHTAALAEMGGDAFHNFEKRLSASKRAALALELHQPHIPRGPFAGLWTIARECWPPWRPLQIVKSWIETPGKAVALARVFRPRARIIIIGHTHYCGSWRRGPRIVMNTGSFLSTVGGRMLVDIAGEKVTLRAIERAGDTFRLGAEIETFTATQLQPQEGF